MRILLRESFELNGMYAVSRYTFDVKSRTQLVGTLYFTHKDLKFRLGP